ncbi:MAG: hypothetical protein HY645_12440 [Acidobacteria bacterium]|nr:hypothetical protein [Acidobacteriota bacterium]
MKRRARVAPTAFLDASPERDWFENFSTSLKAVNEEVRRAEALEWVVWTLVSLSLLLAVLAGTFMVRGMLEFSSPFSR